MLQKYLRITLVPLKGEAHAFLMETKATSGLAKCTFESN